MDFTPEQALAISARGENLLLSAAAGSGKTTVLVERVLALIDDGHSLDDMLIVTFSRAAAADMREKLTEKLTARAEKSEMHRAQLMRVERASLMTIHAFCTELLRAHFEAADVDPAFRVLDGTEDKRLLNAAMEEALEALYEAGGPDLEALDFGRGASGAAENGLALYRFSLERPEPRAWLDECLRLTEGGGEIWLEELKRAAKRRLREARTLAERALAMCYLPGGPEKFVPAVLSDCEQLDAALAAPDYAALRAALAAYAPARRPPAGKGVDENLAAGVAALRETVKEALRAEGKNLPEAGMDDVRAAAPALRACVRLAKLVGERAEARKRELSALTFNDLEHRALKALADPEVRETLRARYTFVFVDEYQDVSDIQEAILERLSRPDNRFMVGDVKQSIYRFRQAEPGLFLDKYARYGAREGGRLIALTHNFRSRPRILNFVNAVFERVMTGGEAEILYDEAARLRPSGSFAGEEAPLEAHLLCRAGEAEEAAEEGEAEEEMDAAEREGAVVAARIRELLGAPYHDGKEWRTLRPRDIAVLTRTRGAMPALEETLREAGLAVYADASEGYFDAVEVRVVLALLRLIENRRRDVEWLTVLRSPIVACSSETLARIRLCAPEGSFRDALLAALANGEEAGIAPEVLHELRRLEADVERYRLLGRVLPITELLALLYRETGYYACVGGLPGGRQRQANLDILIDRAEQFSRAQGGGLRAFLEYCREIRASGSDWDAAHELGEADDVVRVMTVHKSKGLEFPVVFAVQMGRTLARPGGKGELRCHRELGAALAVHDMRLGTRRESIARRAIGERKALEDFNEEMRVLYVLLTRAKERLILVGRVRDLAASQEKWELAAEGPTGVKCFWDATMPVLLSMPGEEARLRYVDERTLKRARAEAQEGQDLAARLDEANAEVPPALARAFDFRYPHAERARLPLKLTATGMLREITGPEAPPALARRPLFLSEGGLTAAERGTLTHAALQGLDLKALDGLSGAALHRAVGEQLAALRARGQLYGNVETALITHFMEGALGLRLRRSPRVEREWAFNLRMGVREALGIDDEASLLVQGVVDCCFLEDGKWVLLDYKTDRADDIEALAARYAPQLQLYEKALERITGLPVAEKRLVLLRAGRDILVGDEG